MISIRGKPDPDIDDEDREALSELVQKITENVEIRLGHEAHYDWVGVRPQRENDASALTNYFVKLGVEDKFESEESKLDSAQPRSLPRKYSGMSRYNAVPRNSARPPRESERRTPD